MDKALYAVVMEAYTGGISTRKVDALVEALGGDSGISKSEVSRICQGLDEQVKAFLGRPLDHAHFPYVYLEAATHLVMLDFPTARPLVMDPKRTFLEKAAAIHVSCRRGRWGSGEGDRYSRHWYDLDRLARAGISEAAVRDRTLAAEVAQHKREE